MVEYKSFELGHFALQKGAILPDAKIVYATVGQLNDAKDNVALFPTWGSGSPEEVVGLMTGPTRTLNPEKYFIVIPNHFNGGFSTSPSNCPPPFEMGRFPRVTVYDNIVAQPRLLTEVLGITSIRLVAGWSMGALLAYHWAAHFPDAVLAIVPIAGSARTCTFNKVFLAGIRSAIVSDPDWNSGFYGDTPPIKGLRQFGRVYAGWGFSEASTAKRCSGLPSGRRPLKNSSRLSGKPSLLSVMRTIFSRSFGPGSKMIFRLTHASAVI